MQITGKVQIKEDITQYDIGNIVDDAVEFIIHKDENDNIQYRPYYLDEGLRFGIIVYLLEGIKLDENETALDVYENDPEIAKIVDSYLNDGAEIFDIKDYIYDIVEFRKSEYVHTSSELKAELKKVFAKEQALNDILVDLATKQNKLLNQQIEENERNEEIMSKLTSDELAELNKKIASGDYDLDKMANIVVERYLAADKHDENMTSVIDEKNNKIKELEKYRDLYEARNGLIDDGK